MQGPAERPVGAGGCFSVLQSIICLFFLPLGCLGSAMVLCKLPVPRRPTNLDNSGTRTY